MPDFNISSLLFLYLLQVQCNFFFGRFVIEQWSPLSILPQFGSSFRFSAEFGNITIADLYFRDTGFFNHSRCWDVQLYFQAPRCPKNLANPPLIFWTVFWPTLVLMTVLFVVSDWITLGGEGSGVQLCFSVRCIFGPHPPGLLSLPL